VEAEHISSFSYIFLKLYQLATVLPPQNFIYSHVFSKNLL